MSGRGMWRSIFVCSLSERQTGMICSNSETTYRKWREINNSEGLRGQKVSRNLWGSDVCRIARLQLEKKEHSEQC